MQLHNVQPVHENKPTMLVGRGGKRGKTSGRGTKGQNARAGHKKRPELRDFIKRLPKLRGRGTNSQKSFGAKAVIVNLGQIEKAFAKGGAVTPALLLEKNLIEMNAGRLPKVKILGAGDITKAIVISGCTISGSAKEKIVKAGGKVDETVAKISKA